MNRQLSETGTIPVTTSIIESLYPELKSADKKVTWLEKQGIIIRLKRGLYVINPEYSGKTLSSELIDNHLYTPSIFNVYRTTILWTYLRSCICLLIDDSKNIPEAFKLQSAVMTTNIFQDNKMKCKYPIKYTL